MRSKRIPDDAEIVRTFDDLRQFENSYFNEEFYFLIVLGLQGRSKSWDFERRCRPYKDQNGQEITIAHYMKGNITPVEAYRAAYEHRNKLLVFDDAERLWADSTGRFLLRDLTECKEIKTVHWRTDNRQLKSAGIESSFETTSRVCLIMNRFAFGDSNEYAAIVDRSHFIYFDPSPIELHNNAALWFRDQEVFDYIGKRLSIVDVNKFSARAYVKTWERKRKGDWREFFDLRYCKKSPECYVSLLEQDLRYQTVDEKVAEFIRQTGLSRATYFNVKKSLKNEGRMRSFDVPRFPLDWKDPDVSHLEESDEPVNESRPEEQMQSEGQDQNEEQERFEDQDEYEYWDQECESSYAEEDAT